MRHRKAKVISLAVLPLLLSACASGTKMFTPPELNRIDDEDDNARRVIEKIEFPGPDPMISRERIEPINLLFMLDPENVAKNLYEKAPDRTHNWDALKIDEKYEWGFHAFYQQPNATDNLKDRRNRIQDRLLISADQRCGIYKRLVNQISADSNYWTGSIATVSGVLGSLLGGNSARNLAAISGISSGMGAEFTQAYYANLAANVITKGIEERRKSIFERIRKAQKVDINDYTVQAAIKDAVFYDTQCSMVSGLEEAQDAIRLAANPGLDAATRILAKQKITAEIVKRDIDQLDGLTKQYEALESASLLGGDRFSNVGVQGAASASTTMTIPPADYYTRLKPDSTPEPKSLGEKLKAVFATMRNVKPELLQLDDSAVPTKPIGAIEDFAELANVYLASWNQCWPATYDNYLSLRHAVDKASDALAREKAVADAEAAQRKMNAVQQYQNVRKTQIAVLRRDYLKLDAATLFDGTPDGTKKDDKGNSLKVKPRSLQDIDNLGGKMNLKGRADAIKSGLQKVCP